MTQLRWCCFGRWRSKILTTLKLTLSGSPTKQLKGYLKASASTKLKRKKQPALSPNEVQAAFQEKNTQSHKMAENNAGSNPAAGNAFTALSRLRLFRLNARIWPDNPGRIGRRRAVQHTRRQAARCRAYCPWCRLRRRRLRPLGAFWLQCLRLRRFVPA